MNNGLEALNDLRTFTECVKTNIPISKVIIEEQCYDIIEKALKKGIAVRKFLVAITRGYTEKDFEDFTVDDLNDVMKENGISITFTQEEYDLLKEVILWVD